MGKRNSIELSLGDQGHFIAPTVLSVTPATLGMRQSHTQAERAVAWVTV